MSTEQNFSSTKHINVSGGRLVLILSSAARFTIEDLCRKYPDALLSYDCYDPDSGYYDGRHLGFISETESDTEFYVYDRAGCLRIGSKTGDVQEALALEAFLIREMANP